MTMPMALGLIVTSTASVVTRCYGFIPPMAGNAIRHSQSTYVTPGAHRLFAWRRVGSKGRNHSTSVDGQEGEDWDSWEFGSFKVRANSSPS